MKLQNTSYLGFAINHLTTMLGYWDSFKSDEEMNLVVVDNTLTVSFINSTVGEFHVDTFFKLAPSYNLISNTKELLSFSVSLSDFTSNSKYFDK